MTPRLSMASKLSSRCSGAPVGGIRGESAYTGLFPERLQSRGLKVSWPETRQWGQLARGSL